MDGNGLFSANDFLWKENLRLGHEVHQLKELLQTQRDCRRALEELQAEHQKVLEENAGLKQRLAELAEQSRGAGSTPAWIKPSVRRRGGKRPGRKAGHAAALRPMPAHVDVHQEVAVPVDALGKASCPECRTQLSQVRHHKRIVEDLIPSKVIVTCYHTLSGWCPGCRQRIESRAPEQPPAADLPHGQLGIEALCTAMMMRICYRMPLGQITRFFAELPGLKVSPGAIARQIQRISRWLDDQYHRLQLSLRLAGVVYADETGWRTAGRNSQLWTITDPRQTLYHVDQSRGGKVIAGLLGENFGTGGQGTLVSDFYGAYDQFPAARQKCLAHLSREIKDLIKEREELKSEPFFKQCRKLIKQMLRLKDQRQQLGNEQYQHQVKLLEKRLVKLAQGKWEDPDAVRLAKRLKKHQGNLTTFLHRPEVDPTNNAAERAIRPAVVMRKITGGSRSQKGADAWAVLASIMRTAQQQGRNLMQTLKDLLISAWAGKECTLLTDLTPAAKTPTPA